MSNFMEIDMSASQEEVLSLLGQEAGRLIQVKNLRQSKRGWSADWEFGVLSVHALDVEDQMALSDAFGLPEGLGVRLWMSVQPFDDGLVSFYGLVACLLRGWQGDMAVLLNGDYPRLSRVNGQVSMRLDCLSQPIVTQFDEFSCRPLPIPADDAVVGRD